MDLSDRDRATLQKAYDLLTPPEEITRQKRVNVRGLPRTKLEAKELMYASLSTILTKLFLFNRASGANYQESLAKLNPNYKITIQAIKFAPNTNDIVIAIDNFDLENTLTTFDEKQKMIQLRKEIKAAIERYEKIHRQLLRKDDISETYLNRIIQAAKYVGDDSAWANIRMFDSEDTIQRKFQIGMNDYQYSMSHAHKFRRLDAQQMLLAQLELLEKDS